MLLYVAFGGCEDGVAVGIGGEDVVEGYGHEREVEGEGCHVWWSLGWGRWGRSGLGRGRFLAGVEGCCGGCTALRRVGAKTCTDVHWALIV